MTVYELFESLAWKHGIDMKERLAKKYPTLDYATDSQPQQNFGLVSSLI